MWVDFTTLSANFTTLAENFCPRAHNFYTLTDNFYTLPHNFCALAGNFSALLDSFCVLKQELAQRWRSFVSRSSNAAAVAVSNSTASRQSCSKAALSAARRAGFFGPVRSASASAKPAFR